jgi:IclR family transcriptional regulator, KDG regulon repressor
VVSMHEPADLGVKSVGLTLDVLEAVAFAGRDMGVTELAHQLGVTKATIFRHLKTLLDRGYVAKTASTSRYRLGIKSHLLGRMASASIDLLSASETAMQDLRDKTGETAVLSAVEAKVVRVVTTIKGKSPFEIGVRSGSDLTFHASAQGKVALAFNQELAGKMSRRMLTALTDRTITDWSQLQRELAVIRNRGWATAPEQVVLGLNAVAAPIFDELGQCVATVAVVGSIQFIHKNPGAQQTGMVVRAAARISQNLGYSPPR